MEWKTPALASLLLLVLTVTSNHGEQFPNQSECPPWMTTEKDGECECNSAYSSIQKSFLRTVYCDRLTLTTYAVSGACFTQANSSHIGKEDYVFGDCTYVPVHRQYYFDSYLKPLPENVSDLDNVMCGPFNRQGLLCSECKPGYGVAVYSIGYPCAKCTNYRGLFALLFILLELVPITVFFVLVVMFRVRATAPPLAGLVFFSHAIIIVSQFRILIHTSMLFSFGGLVRIGWQIGIFFCSIWGLEFFRILVPPFCMDPHLGNVEAVLLEYVSAFYPMVLVLITYVAIELHSSNVRFLVWLWGPFNKLFARFRRSWDIRYSIVNAFSTFLLLSYSKILTVSFRLLYQTSIYDLNGRRIARGLHIDPTIQSFGSATQSFISITAISIIIIFAVLPLLLLILYPTSLFQKALRRCTFRAKHALVMFVDTYQGCLKDGSDGTRDYRIVSTLYLILRISLLSLYTSESAAVRDGVAFIIYALLFNAAAIFILKFQPYKEQSMNTLEFITLMMLGNLALFTYIWIVLPQWIYAMAIVVIGLTPHCVIACFFVYTSLLKHRMKQWYNALKTHFTSPNRVTSTAVTYLLQSLSINYSATIEQETELPDRFINPDNYTTSSDTSYKEVSTP